MNADTMEAILELARWAPSADNTQVWEFEIIDDLRLLVHGRFIGENCVYDLEGHVSEMGHGALLETLSIAATAFGLRTRIEHHPDSCPDKPIYAVSLQADLEVEADPLIGSIEKRSVQRRGLRTRPLSASEKHTLETALPPGYRVAWFETPMQRLRMALLMFRFAGIRLTIPEAYQVHKKVIEWDSQYSEDRIPDQALGIDPLLTRAMRWAMRSWSRITLLNRFAAGTWLPRVEMELIPGLGCAAHFAVVSEAIPDKPDDHVAAGRAMQRFWLTATQLGLQLQPEMAPVVFSGYVTRGIRFTSAARARKKAAALARRFEHTIGKANAQRTVFMGRIGSGSTPRARSLRKPLSSLLRASRV